ncbi:hypothetical protein ABU178_10020 [Pantoea osteomyelitidis]|uniref:DNA-binding protein n=1 Tax=Pantoea osteomyelitidis TaxID=3230026 RepID=A0ABW7PW08_9GAMM
MRLQSMNVHQMARYAEVEERLLVRAICNQGTLDGVPLPEAVTVSPLSSRRWLREDARQFKHALARARAMKQRPSSGGL